MKEIDRLRNEALRLLREDEALAFVISPAGRIGREEAEANRKRIQQGPKPELQQYIRNVERHVQERRREFGVTATSEELIQFLEAAEAVPPGQVCLPTVMELRGFFRDYAQVWPDSKHLPAHARVILDLHGCGPNGEPVRGIRLLEASIYEDMAALWNLIHERAGADNDTAPRRERKTVHALCRAALAAAVYFVEAYLNGLAFDYLADHGNEVTEDEKSALSEWDFKRNSPRFLSLREKILRYQRIILKVEHAPIQPSNCAELDGFLRITELFRNPLAHPAPHPNPNSGAPDKELAIFTIRVETAQEAVNSAIAVVRKLEGAVHGDLLRLPWLLSRSPAGPFPLEAFE